MSSWLKFPLLTALMLMTASVPKARIADDGQIEGFVRDQAGPIAGASVEIHNLVTGAMQRGESDALGRYLFVKVRPGRYSLWVEAMGHDSVWIPRIVVDYGQAVQQNIFLNRSVIDVTSLAVPGAGEF